MLPVFLHGSATSQHGHHPRVLSNAFKSFETIDSIAWNDLALVVSAMQLLLVLVGLIVTFRGMSAKRSSYFLATFMTFNVISVYSLHYCLVGFTVAFVVGTVVAFMAEPRIGAWAIGFGLGATVTDAFFTVLLGILDVPTTTELSWGIMAVVLAIGLICACHALNENALFLAVATSCTGAFAVSNSLVAAMDCMLPAPTTAAALAILLGAGGILMVGWIVHQKSAASIASTDPISSPIERI
ncbi:hypothetical protein H310_09549 [Aphanomyces invadans]|uniref:DUF4203 domain-containing protein n=1 Tax=Aphanomyces invadans TaxID=157072 RepID=A0A024TUF3_9STRA|nr:hypothetical protein H310_09549 [Aphanomyces invadans]ETV97658.1 hypothetical protein H310_09549 [Aphanomyces invadans]RHY26869.1 hypothetical protein DYB32_007222 [Aphanomyces invadans]|eukprot:XP_008873867.1 hypothetical protein H310_09549 [Aphanomyces invadans]